MLAFIFVFLSTTGLVYATDTEYIKLETGLVQTLDISDDAVSGMEFINPEHVYDSKLRAPASQVTDIGLVGIYLTTDNKFLARVLVVGNGVYNATINGSKAEYLGWYDTIGTIPVVAWYEEFDLGNAVSGSHTFSLTARSHNFPYSTVSRSWDFTY